METSLLSLYLRLFHCDWLSPVQFSRRLVQAGSLQKILSADDDCHAAHGMTEFQIDRLRNIRSMANPKTVDQDLEWSEADGNSILCFEDSYYPELLRQIDVPPPLLFIRGQVEALTRPQLAIVGSRKATSYGLRNAYWMAHELSMAGLCITSGMARGIDTRAHQGAIASGNATIAIIGTGIDITYPISNQKLAEAIAANGAMVSEFARGTPPIPINFPRRNRIMSGLSMGTLVVEATIKSGTLITAKLALEQNREVFAIPGLINNPQSAGCHQLISDGARLVQQPTDILQEFGINNICPAENTRSWKHLQADCDTQIDELTRIIGFQGCDLEYLLEASGIDYQLLLTRLIDLEIAGEIQVTGGRYFRT